MAIVSVRSGLSVSATLTVSSHWPALKVMSGWIDISAVCVGVGAVMFSGGTASIAASCKLHAGYVTNGTTLGPVARIDWTAWHTLEFTKIDSIANTTDQH